MLKVIYLPEHQELIYAVSIALLNTEDKYLDDSYSLIPKRAKDLNKEDEKLTNMIVNDITDIVGEDYSGLFHSEQKDYYILVGIHPETEKDYSKIYNFFEKNENEIILWIDWHEWPENLANFLKSQSDKIHIDKTKTPLQILEAIGYDVIADDLISEEAMIRTDMTNDNANRYWKIYLSARALGLNNNKLESLAYFSFLASVAEIIANEENKSLSEMVKAFNEMTEEAIRLENEFSDELPVFQKAKEMGRPVGCLILDDVSDYFFLEEIIGHGVKKYPWLCIVIFNYNGIRMYNCASEKIAISEIIKNYCPDISRQEEFFKILNEEVIRISTNP